MPSVGADPRHDAQGGRSRSVHCGRCRTTMRRLCSSSTGWCPTAWSSCVEGRAVVVGPEDGDLAGADAVIAGSRRWDGAAMDLAPRLRVISRTGVGYDTVDVEAATARGIAVCFAPDAPTVSTAEHTVALLLAVTKDISGWADRSSAVEPGAPPGIELDGRTLGLFGFGRIARRVATVGRALGMHVIAHDPFVVAGTRRRRHAGRRRRAVATIGRGQPARAGDAVHVPRRRRRRPRRDATRLVPRQLRPRQPRRPRRPARRARARSPRRRRARRHRARAAAGRPPAAAPAEGRHHPAHRLADRRRAAAAVRPRHRQRVRRARRRGRMPGPRAVPVPARSTP